jgi:hypothetical protein
MAGRMAGDKGGERREGGSRGRKEASRPAAVRAGIYPVGRKSRQQKLRPANILDSTGEGRERGGEGIRKAREGEKSGLFAAIRACALAWACRQDGLSRLARTRSCDGVTFVEERV